MIEERERLEEERDFLLRSLRDLDEERAAGDLGGEDYDILRDDYTARAAAVIRALEADAGTAAEPPAGPAAGEPAPEVAPEVAAPPAPRPGSRRWLTVVAVAAVAVLAGLGVARWSGERLPGQPASGSLPDTTTERLARAEALVADGKVLDAIKLYDRILGDDPQQPVALANRGWLVSRAGLVDEGLSYIDRALAADSSYAQAHFFKGMILYRDRQDPAAAAAEFEAALAAGLPADLTAFVEDLRQRARRDSGQAP